MARAGVFGRPITHSLSPLIHNAGYAAAGLEDWSYSAHDCGDDELAGVVAELGAEWAGLSLTMPLKRAGLDVAAEVAPLAAAIGATNTLVRADGGIWRAENTDAPGLVDALRGAGVAAATDVAVLGAGGTARATLAAARDLGATTVRVYARRPWLVAELDPVAAALGVELIPRPWDRAPEAAAAQVVVSTVPRGGADELAGAARWRPDSVVVDAVYDPWPTPLARAAQACGATVVGGLELLLAQALRQFELFTGVVAPAAAMRAALDQRAS